MSTHATAATSCSRSPTPPSRKEITRFQTDALLQIEKADPSLPVPRIIPTLERRRAFTCAALPDQGACVVRLLTFLHGEQLYKTERTPTQRRNIGTCLARLDKALQGRRSALHRTCPAVGRQQRAHICGA